MPTLFRHVLIGGKRGWWVALLILSGGSQLLAAPGWQSSLTREPPGNFPPPRALHASYIFGWSGFTAATAEVQLTKPSPDRAQLQGNGRTIGLARTLWRYDVN